ncbi:unnamed protein product [Caenorhabditis auriculariae]|uniref:TIL domain-containing protein n=1 Tax=Caenorhabditis auriculariae TaxID=2777116 RepID=A0A8S1HWA9_9PELO|nr:unnamed protein product [Caenorhabditis auriculariae]
MVKLLTLTILFATLTAFQAFLLPRTEPKCGENQHLNRCGNECDEICYVPKKPCKKVCYSPACACLPGFARLFNSKSAPCISKSDPACSKCRGGCEPGKSCKQVLWCLREPCPLSHSCEENYKKVTFYLHPFPALPTLAVMRGSSSSYAFIPLERRRHPKPKSYPDISDNQWTGSTVVSDYQHYLNLLVGSGIELVTLWTVVALRRALMR